MFSFVIVQPLQQLTLCGFERIGRHSAANANGDDILLGNVNNLDSAVGPVLPRISDFPGTVQERHRGHFGVLVAAGVIHLDRRCHGDVVSLDVAEELPESSVPTAARCVWHGCPCHAVVGQCFHFDVVDRSEPGKTHRDFGFHPWAECE